MNRDTDGLLPQDRRHVRTVLAPRASVERRAGRHAVAYLDVCAPACRRADIEAEARFGRLFLDHDEVALLRAGMPADDLIDREVEAEERHVRLHGAPERGVLLILRFAAGLAYTIDHDRLRNVDNRAWIATQQRAAQQHHEAVA